MSFSHAWRIDRDLVLWVDHDPGLVCTAALPSLEARPPLLFRGAPASGDVQLQLADRLQVMLSRHAGGRTIDMLALPTDRQRAEYEPVADLLDVVERRLFTTGKAPIDARFVIEAVAYPFVRQGPERKRQYCWRPPPVWMPVYWHRHLVSTGRDDEARRLLYLLDEIASPLPETQPEYGWDPGWSAREGQIELAARYVRRQSRNLAEACRAGGLPQGWYCLLFYPAPQSNVSGSRVYPSAYPPTLRAMFERLAQTSPESLEAVKRS